MLCDFEKVPSLGAGNPLQIPDSKLSAKYIHKQLSKEGNESLPLTLADWFLPSLLGPVPWELVCMDFFNGLPGPRHF